MGNVFAQVGPFAGPTRTLLGAEQEAWLAQRRRSAKACWKFVGPSVSSPGLDDPTGSTTAFLRSVNPHFKYIDLNCRGYMLLDVTP